MDHSLFEIKIHIKVYFIHMIVMFDKKFTHIRFSLSYSLSPERGRFKSFRTRGGQNVLGLVDVWIIFFFWGGGESCITCHLDAETALGNMKLAIDPLPIMLWAD